jgi:DNA-directed RNA polymerase subunit RPC12/RpoP
MNDHILPEPPDAGFSRTCRSCGRWFALKLESSQPDKTAGKLYFYRCRYCGTTIIYADRHPPHVV